MSRAGTSVPTRRQRAMDAAVFERRARREQPTLPGRLRRAAVRRYIARLGKGARS